MEQLFDPAIISSTIRMVTPILLAALGGMLCVRAGIFNVGLEGLMLMGAFSAVAANHLTGSLVLSAGVAVGVTMLFALLFAFLTIQLQANEIVVGIAINFLAAGVSTFALRTLFDVKGAFYDKNMKGLPKWEIPIIKDLPVVGEILSGHSPLVYLSFILVLAFAIFFSKTVAGFRLHAIGLNKYAAKSMGIKTVRYQYAAIAGSGVLCGLAGMQLALGQVTMFSEGMTSGRGFIALVAMMLGQSSPGGTLAASLFFGLMDALSIRVQSFSIPTQFTLMIPYAVTILALIIFKDRYSLNKANTQK